MSRSSFDPEAVRLLAAILAETGLTEIEIVEKDMRIRVVRAPAPVAVPVSVPPTLAGGPTSASDGATVSVAASVEADDAEHPGAVLSPMVGVVYLAPEPGSPPFVSVGQSVTAGQTLLLIEAMKTFNQVKAPKSGVVARILVSSGTPVEYGEPLMVLE